jgi:quinol-cytochrome oxidoreductase complex cytochrome b subunit
MKEEKSNGVKWYYRPFVVIFLLFFVLGAFGLPLLIKSPKFTRKQKIIIGIIITLYTAYLIYLTWEAWTISLSMTGDLIKALRGF